MPDVAAIFSSYIIFSKQSENEDEKKRSGAESLKYFIFMNSLQSPR